MLQPYLRVAVSESRGRGVFTDKNIPEGTTIEISPVIVLTPKDRKILEQTKLYYYVFEWGVSKRKAAMALGYVSMYNHSYNANCEYEMDYEAENIAIKTVRKIMKGEELFINYNAVYNNETPVWFDVK
jgi:SET domain-containing protein